MSLQKCYECGKDVSSMANACPHCGAPVNPVPPPLPPNIKPPPPPVPQRKKRRLGCVGCGGALIIGFVVWMVVSNIVYVREGARQEEVRQEKEAAAREKEAAARAAFMADIDSQYARLVELMGEKRFEEAVELLDEFRRFGQMEFQDIVALNKSVRTSLLLAKLEGLPENDFVRRSRIYRDLAHQNPEVEEYASERERYASLVKAAARLRKRAEASRKKASKSKSNEGKLIGRWLDESPIIGGRITISERDGRPFLQQQFKDGSSQSLALVERSAPRGRIFEEQPRPRSGDHFLLRPDGHLEIRDNEGLIAVAKPLQ